MNIIKGASGEGEKEVLVIAGDGKESGERMTTTTIAETSEMMAGGAAELEEGATAAPATATAATLGRTVAIMTDGEEVGKKITTDALKEDQIHSLQKEENSSSEFEDVISLELPLDWPDVDTGNRDDSIKEVDLILNGNINNSNNAHQLHHHHQQQQHRNHRHSAPPGWRRDTIPPHPGQTLTSLSALMQSTSLSSSSAVAQGPDPYGWDEGDTFHDVVRRNNDILQLEKAHHLHYLLEYRVRQCPLFLLGKCQSHKPFTCFHWHFLNQRRRRPARRRNGSYNYSPYVYCSKYDEKTGFCEDGDDCTYLHHNLGDTECIYHLRYFKTTPCIHESNEIGVCRRYGRHCAFCHSEDDFRAPIFDIPSPAMAPLLTYCAPIGISADSLAAVTATSTTTMDCVRSKLGKRSRNDVDDEEDDSVDGIGKNPRHDNGGDEPNVLKAARWDKVKDDNNDDNDGKADDVKEDDVVEGAGGGSVGGRGVKDAKKYKDSTMADAPSDMTRRKGHQSFGIWEQALNQARAACAAWKEEAEEAKIEKEQKEKERDEERKKKEEALIACERLSAKMALLRDCGDDFEAIKSFSSAEMDASDFWRFLSRMEDGFLKLDGVSLDKLAEMKRILTRSLKDVDVAIVEKNSVLRKIWIGE